jgi:phosphoenolpyruvate-protein phosphotransferase (PTS system enzyme I)
MQKLQGIAVSPGVVIGEAFVLSNEGIRIPRYTVARDAVDHELHRLNMAIQELAEELEQNRDSIAGELGEGYGEIFEAHLQILNGFKLRSDLEQLVQEKAYSPEHAVNVTFNRYARVFQDSGNPHMAERANDMFDLEKQLLRRLLGREREELSDLKTPVLVLASNLTPSETAHLNREFVLGFVTEEGGSTSHTAIVASALEIPAIVGTGPFLSNVSGGDSVIIDGDAGVVIIDPDEATLERYYLRAESAKTAAVELETIVDLPAMTLDGCKIELHGNIEFPYEAAHCLERGGDGIGLYRTEFLYLDRVGEPDEETHYKAYMEVAEAMQGLPVTIRTFDMGADKIPYLSTISAGEENPMLGLRSIRLALRNRSMLHLQLRAILRANADANLRVMFPLISTLTELRRAKMIVKDVIDDLHESGERFSPDIPIGMMVEVPSAAILIDQFVEEVDFLSIGTNDLVQYCLAVDRGNRDVVNLYNSEDPAILRLIRRTIREGDRKKIPVSLCGQMAGNPLYTMLLIGLGLRYFSASPSALLEVKKVCREVSLEQCREVARYVTSLESAGEIKRYLRSQLSQLNPRPE